MSKCCGPLNILGRTATIEPAVAIIGDSLIEGEPSQGDALCDRGLAERGIAAQAAWCNFATGGDSVAAFLAGHDRRMALIGDHFTHALCALGIADVRRGNEAETRRDFVRLWTLLADAGLKVFQTTLTTHTRSTDRWTSAAGQVVANPNFLPGGMHQRINEWIRSVPAPLAGIFDPSELLETGRDSGIWISPDGQPITRDGPHLNPLGAEIGAKSIDVGRLRH